MFSFVEKSLSVIIFIKITAPAINSELWHILKNLIYLNFFPSSLAGDSAIHQIYATPSFFNIVLD